MPGRTALLAGLPRAVRHVPGLRRLPVVRLLVVLELALLAQSHLQRLAPEERRRLLQIARRRRGMSASERRELQTLLGKLDVRTFVGSARHLVPVRVPGRSRANVGA